MHFSGSQYYTPSVPDEADDNDIESSVFLLLLYLHTIITLGISLNDIYRVVYILVDQWGDGGLYWCRFYSTYRFISRSITHIQYSIYIIQGIIYTIQCTRKETPMSNVVEINKAILFSLMKMHYIRSFDPVTPFNPDISRFIQVLFVGCVYDPPLSGCTSLQQLRCVAQYMWLPA